MTRNRQGRVLAVLLAVGIGGAAFAQGRGRTDGPEGSEYGKGGYADPGAGQFSLTLNWGAALSEGSPPLFVGLTGTFWADEWFVLDVSPAYLFNTGRVNLLLGPRFRTSAYPVSLSLGLQAGPVIVRDDGLRFALSPQAGVETIVKDHFVAGLGYAWDIAFGAGNEHRVFMSMGYRF
jgi:hypothetical protein